jgi:CheY-like chemotaxis protein
MDQVKMPRERCVHIVDDEARVRDALTLLLSTAQIESRCYASAEEYLASVPLKEPACILLDNQLPGMSGIELLKRITGTASNSAVIMITGYGDVPMAVSVARRRRPRRSAGNRRNKGSVRASNTARARGPRSAIGGTADQAHCPPIRDQREND